MSSIYSIGTAVPPFKNKQEDILLFMQKMITSPVNERMLKSIYRNSSITSRYSVIPDYTCELSERLFYPPSENLLPFPSLEERLHLFNVHAPVLAASAATDCISRFHENVTITHLITVSCTGMSAPGLEIDLVHRLGLSTHVHRTSVNFMGCYAVFHALKMADAICKNDLEANVLIVSVELCTLHFQKEETVDNMLANSLFSDGAAAVLVSGKVIPGKSHMKINSFFSDIDSSGKNDMAWTISSTGFRMTLSPQIPGLIEKGASRLMQRLPKYLFNGSADATHWAIHPGGKRIIDATQQALHIPLAKLAPSTSVLDRYGNMSSASVVFVLKEMWDHYLDWSKPEYIFSAGYGPGLAIESALMETCTN